MRTSPVTSSTAQVSTRIPRLRAKRSFARVPQRGISTRACHIDLPRKLWDRIILLMFIYCLFIFLRAFFGLGEVDGDLRVSNGALQHPRKPLSASPWNRRPTASNEEQKIRAPSMTRVMVDWHGNYELPPSTAVVLASSASIPQEAFPDPTPTLVGAGRARAPGEGPLSVTTKVKSPVDTPSTIPYDPFRLVFEDSGGGGYHRLYPVAGPPRTARTRRFGRCFPGETCL